MRGRKAGSACAPRYHAEPEPERAPRPHADALARLGAWAISLFPMTIRPAWWLLPLLASSAAAGLAACGLDTQGTAEAFDAPFDVGAVDAPVSPADTGAPTVPTDAGCVGEAGATCSSPAGCTTGTVLCDGTCNAPPDPLSVGSKCTTPKGCNGAYDCEGVCKGEPLSTGSPCTTTNGCAGQEACDGTCAGDPPNVGKTCATPLGCASKLDCAGACKDAPGVGAACSVSGCANGKRDCGMVCRLPAGAKQPCKSKTCGFDETTDCMGVCPDPKRDTTVTCRTCSPCAGGPIAVKQDQCGVCPTCAAAGCVPPGDAGPDASDAPDATDAAGEDDAARDGASDATESG